MSKHLTESLEKAYSLLNEDVMEVVPVVDGIEEVPVEIEEIPIEEVQEETPEPVEEVEERLSNLEAEIEEVKNLLVAQDSAPLSEFDSSIEATISPEEEFSNKVYKDLLFYSKLPESCEITEELLDKPNFKVAYIPSIANKNRISTKEVRDILLGRPSKGDDK